MSDKSIASIARSIASTLLDVCGKPISEAMRDTRLIALEAELVAEYRAEVSAAVRTAKYD